jgi:hypothetical protein
MKKGLIKNKKGLELAINTIVLLVLAMVFLLFMILFFTGTSGTFVTKIKGYFTYSNVDDVITGCNIFADSEQNYGYCCEKKFVKYVEDGENKGGEFSCLEITNKSFGKDVKKLNCEDVSC